MALVIAPKPGKRFSLLLMPTVPYGRRLISMMALARPVSTSLISPSMAWASL